MRLGYRLGNTEAVDAMYRDGLLDPLCGLIMGETAENLVDMYGISRTEQDEFAVASQRKAVEGAEARAAEIVPVEVTSGRETVSITEDEHVRPDTTMETLGKLAPVFREGGSVTAGNSSGITDGGAAMVLMSESRATAEGREPIAAITAMSWAGVPPGDHGDRAGARHEEGHGSPGVHDRRLRGDRDQRGLRRAGDRLRTRPEVRS